MDQHFNWIFRFQPLISTYYKADQPTLWPIPLLFLQKLVYYDAQFRLFYGVNSSINVLLPSCNLVSVKTWKAVYNFYINYESIYSCLKDTKLGCRHSSVDSSVPTILLPWVQIPNKPSMLLFFIVKFVLYLSCEKNENKTKKESGFGRFLKKHKTPNCMCTLSIKLPRNEFVPGLFLFIFGLLNQIMQT